MNTKFFRIVLAVFVLGMLIAPHSRTVTAQSPELPAQIEQAVQAGLDWLIPRQQADGSWPGGCESVAYTGLAVLKLETHAIEDGFDPLDPTYPYAANVQAGLDYIMANANLVPIGPEPAGNPDSNGNGLGVKFYACWGSHEIYNTGIAMMALSASGHPEIYGDILQDAVDFMAWAQADPDCGLHRGGWRYSADSCDSDNSNSGYVTLGLGYAASSPPYGMNIQTPAWVVDELSIWLDVIQDDVNGDGDDGGSWYDPYWSWVNILKTGNLLYEFGLVGDSISTPRAQDALDYIERHWFDSGGCDTGWQFHRQAMFTMMKGLEGMGIDLLDLDGDGIPEHDWFEEVALHLIGTQNADGSWPWDCWGDQVLSTLWAMLTLEKAVPELRPVVAIDIKPQSADNIIDLTSLSNIPVAVLSTADFNAPGLVDYPTLTFGHTGDEASLYYSAKGKLVCYPSDVNGDGLADLLCMFKVSATGFVCGDTTGILKGFKLDGGPFIGEDLVTIAPCP